MIGLGDIGLPTATLFASRKKTATAVDVPAHVVAAIIPERIRLARPKLDGLAHASATEGCLRATLTPEPAATGRLIDAVGW